MTDDALSDLLNKSNEIAEANGEKLESIKEAIELSGKSLPRLSADDPGKVISLSYILRQAQSGDGDLGKAMLGLLSKELDWYSGNQGARDPRWSQAKWLKDDMRVDAQYDKEWSGGWQYIGASFWIKYSWVGIDPSESAYTDESAHTKVVSSTPYEHQGHGFLIDLTDSDSSLSFERTESVTEEQQRSVQMTHTTEIDVGVSSETTVGGSIGGVGVEEKIGATFGYKDSTEKQEAESKSKSKTVEVKIAYEAQPRTATLLTVESNQISALTPFNWNGSVIYGIKLIAWKDVLDTRKGGYMRNSKRAKILYDKGGFGETWEITWTDWDDFLAFWQGTNTDFPESVNNPASGDAVPFLTALENPDIRYINLAGTEHRNYQDGAAMKVQDVTGQDVQAVAAKHGAQIIKS